MIEKLQQSHPKIYKHFFTVTTFSKLVALSLFIILPFVGFYLGMKYQQLVTVANTPIVSAVQKTTNDITKATKEQVKFLSVNAICDNGPVKGLSIKLNKAYLLSSFADFPSYKIQEFQKSGLEGNGLLILEADVRNLQTSGGTQGIYGSDILRLRKDAKDYEPIIYGATMVAPQRDSVIYTYFPIDRNERNFKIMYCNFADHPSVVSLDFDSSISATLTGEYFINRGFVASK